MQYVKEPAEVVRITAIQKELIKRYLKAKDHQQLVAEMDDLFLRILGHNPNQQLPRFSWKGLSIALVPGLASTVSTYQVMS